MDTPEKMYIKIAEELIEANNFLEIPTLGWQAHMMLNITENNLIQINNRYTVTHVNWALTIARIKQLINVGNNAHTRTGNYNTPNWNPMPQGTSIVISPYIPAIIRYFENDRVINTTYFQG
jgi:hypothetical protein